VARREKKVSQNEVPVYFVSTRYYQAVEWSLVKAPFGMKTATSMVCSVTFDGSQAHYKNNGQ